jgi:hypothetical protein
MQDEANPAGLIDSITPAKQRIQTGPIPAWVAECAYSPQFKAESHAPFTYLLENIQIHAERREFFNRRIIRLDTMDAVQHFSQWRLQFEPKTQLITLHTLKIRRGETETDHLNLNKAHVLQREEGLEKFVIHGWFTFLMILEDVRPGDILEFAYTIQSQPRLLPDNYSSFLALPLGAAVGKYQFVAQFAEARGMKWKSSADNLKPVETRTDGLVSWKWEGENFIGPKPEGQTPSWHLAFPWIQFSDIPDWKTIASAVAEAWAATGNEQSVTAMAQEIESKETGVPARIERAIRLIQDEYRYLSVNLEFGGQIPTAPETVIQRRFGDCKDLSWLLANLLRKLGVSARPILVNSIRRKTIGEFLPSPWLFDHVIVEFEFDGKRRWVDATLKQQGGGPFNRAVGKFDLGLPVDANAVELVSGPQVPAYSGLFELNENVLLATSGDPAFVAVVQKTEGFQADLLRQQLDKMGLEEMARQRLKSATGRFRNASRAGSLQYRDDREANRFVLAEVFEFHPLLASHPNPKLCRIPLSTNWVAGALVMPEKTERKTPFVLPYPCRLLHVMDIEAPAIQQIKVSDPSSKLSSPFVEFNRTTKAGHGYIVIKFELETKVDSVPASEVLEHRKTVEHVWQAASRELTLLRGYSGPRKKTGFGELPPVGGKMLPPLPARSPVQTSTAPKSSSSASTSHRRKHSEHRRQEFPRWLKVVIAVLITLGLLFVIALLNAPSGP